MTEPTTRPPSGESAQAEEAFPFSAAELTAAARLASQATGGITRLVQSIHQTVLELPILSGLAQASGVTSTTSMVYDIIHRLNDHLAGQLASPADQWREIDEHTAHSRQRLATLAILNGIIGDRLVADQSPLALPMSLSPADHPQTGQHPPGHQRKLLIQVHGLCLSDQNWTDEQGHSHAARIADSLGYSIRSLRYNSGRAIRTNGALLSQLLEHCVSAWPVPLDELVLMGHSMGGLLCRSACDQTQRDDALWRRSVTRLICLGSPHAGAPLEKAGEGLQSLLGTNRWSAPFRRLGAVRSAGITDLRHGLTENEAPHRLVPLPEDLSCYLLAATRSATDSSKSPRSDGLVTVNSALGIGRHGSLEVPETRQHTVRDCGHLDILHHPEVCETVLKWLAESR